jgi:hypothetical protein
MIIDQNTYLSKLQADVLTVAVYPSTNVIDLTQVTNRTPISGMWLVCRVVSAFTTAASGTVTFSVVCSAAAGLGTATTFYTSGALACATLIANYLVVAMRVPATIPLRYFGMTYEVVTGTVAAGTITTFLTPDMPFVSIL